MIEKIKAEIERLKDLHRTPTFPGDEYEEGGVNGYQLALGKLLSFIESLEKEPKVELEKEIEDYTLSCNGVLEGQTGQSWEFDWEDITMVIDEAARHFYELGLKTQKGE